MDYRASTRLVTSLVIHEACNEMDFGRAAIDGISRYHSVSCAYVTAVVNIGPYQRCPAADAAPAGVARGLTATAAAAD